ncbi:MAG: sulfite exporter TauE/SafE family protein [Ignavibacteria bacterium]|nr:sulfite exporter TauE/SafE family protein [Ignavibacteria bacterium]
MLEFLFYILLILVAFLYSSVGHGGASGYLALMALFSFSPEIMRPTALVLNVFVSFIAFTQYYRAGYFQWKLFWPFAIVSIPAAFIGGLVSIDPGLYKMILGILLFFPIIRLAGLNFKSEQSIRKLNIYAALLIGVIIGFLSGMIGIGGGIILSPVILILHWADMKQTSAVSALFIFVNSIAGLAGIFTDKLHFTAEMGLMIVIALTGAIAGAYLGAKKFESALLKRILAVVLLIASIKLIST